MSSNNVDNRVVNMTFNNEQFEAGVKQTLSTLEELKESLKFNNATTGISALSNAISNFQISNISDQIDVLTNRFSTLGIVGMTAIENITNKVMNFATSKISSTLGQITSGGWNRASSIAQSRFTLEGLLNDAEKVETAFNSASNAVDGTAYSLDSAVSAASQLAASGIDVGQDMEDTLKAIAGTAAMTGDSFDSVANIFTTVAGNGRLMGMQLTQLSTHGLNAAATIADYLGKTEAEVREMVSDGEISFETFSNAMQSAFGEHAKDANKTFSGSMDNIKSALSRIGAIFSSGIIENDDLINTLNDVRLTINKIKEAMLPLESTFKNMVSAVSKLASSLINGLDLSGIDKFVDYVAIGMEYITDIADRWSKFNDSLRASVLGDVAEDAEKVNEAIHASAEEIQMAKDIWEKGWYDVGEARRDEVTKMGQDYDTVQYLVNQLAAGITDLSEVDVSAVKETESAVNDMADATENAAEQQERATIPIIAIVRAFSTFGEGVKIIFHNIKVVVSKLATTFTKVFSWQKFIKDIKDYGKLFSEFIGNFGLTEERASKLENAFSGMWSAIDLLRKAIKFLITAGLKILGPILSVVFDIILDVTSVIGSAITKINEWTDKHSFLTDAISWFGEVLKKVVETVKTFFTELWNLPAVQEIKDRLGELASLLIDKLSPYFETAGEKIKDFFAKFTDADKDGAMTKVLDGINTALENIIGFSDDATTAIGDFTSYIGGGIADLLGFKSETEGVEKNIKGIKSAGEDLVKSDSIGGFFSNLGDLASKMGGKVGDIIDSIIEKFNSIDGATVAMVGFGTGITAVGLSFSYLSFNIGNFVKTLTNVPLEISNTIKSFRGIFDGIKKYLENKSQAEVIKSFAIALAVLVASLVALTFVDQDKLWSSAEALGSLLLIMALVVTVITQTSKKMATNKNFFKSMLSLSLMFIAISASALILVEALSELTNIKWDKDVIKPCVALVAILGALVGLAFVFSKVQGGFSTAALNVLALSVGVYLVAKALVKLKDVKLEGLEDKVKALAVVIVALGAAGALMSKISFGSALGILTLLGSIYLVELMLIDIMYYGVSWDEIKDNMDKFIPILVVLGTIGGYLTIVGLACKESTKMTGTILATAVAILVIVYAIKAIGDLPLTSIAKGLGAVIVIMIALGFLLKVVPKESKSIPNLVKLAIAIGLLSVVVALVGRLKLETIGKGLLVVFALMLFVTAFVVLTRECKGVDYKTLYAFVVAIGVMSVAVVLLSKMKDLNRVLQAAGIIGMMLVAFGTSMYLANKWSKKTKTSAIVAMVVALIVIVGSLFLLTNYTKNIDNVVVAALAIGAVMLTLGVTFGIIGKTFDMLGNKQLKGGRMQALILMIVMLAGVAVALYFLSSQTSEGLIVSAAAIIGVMYLVLTYMGEFLTTLSTLKINNNVLKGIGAAIVLLVAVAGSLALLFVASKGSSWTTMATAAVALGLVLFEVIKLLKYINLSGSEFKAGVIVNVIAAVVLLGAVAGALSVLLYYSKGSSFDQILVVTLAIGLIMAEVVGLLQFIDKSGSVFKPGVIVNVLAAIALLAAVSYALKEVIGTQADWQTIMASAKAMSLALVIVTACMAALIALTSAFGGVGVAAAAVVLLSFSAVLLSLGSAFKSFGKASKDIVSALEQLTKIDFKVLKENTGTLWQLVAIAGALSLIASVLGVGLVSIGIGLAAIGIGAIPVVAELVLIVITIGAVSKAVTALIEAFDHLVTTFSTSNGSIKSGITEIGTGLAGAITGFVTTLAVQAPVIKASILVLISTITSLITEGVNSIIDIILDGIIHLLTSLEEKLPTINEKINAIIISVLSSIAENASTFGYYGAVIAISFLYGISEGLVEYSDELGETVANVIVALFNMMGTLIDTLMPYLADGIEKGVLNVNEALWGVLAETGWDYAEEQYDKAVDKQMAYSEQKSAEMGEAVDQALGTSISENSDVVDDAAETMVDSATDKSDVAEENANKTGTTYADSTKSSILNSFDTDEIKNKLGNYLNFDLSGSGAESIKTWSSGAEDEVDKSVVNLSGYPSDVAAEMKKKYEEQGYVFEGNGKYIGTKIQDGLDTTEYDLTGNWDDSEAELYSAADETAEGMTEKGENSGENYGTGMATGINNTVEDVKEAAQNLADTVEETVNVTLEIKSPSRKGIRSGEFYGMGFGNGISNMAGYVKKASVSLAQSAVTSVAEMMGKIDTIMNDEDINWQPTFTPVIDSSQIQNGINYLGNINAESVGLATDASISVNNSQQATLAAQVQALSDQVQRLADTDYSKILDGVAINVDASTNVDGTPLRRMSSSYTIQQINDTQNGLIMAAGGRV